MEEISEEKKIYAKIVIDSVSSSPLDLKGFTSPLELPLILDASRHSLHPLAHSNLLRSVSTPYNSWPSQTYSVRKVLPTPLGPIKPTQIGEYSLHPLANSNLIKSVSTPYTSWPTQT